MIFQIVTIGGSIIESAKFDVQTDVSFKECDKFSVSFKVENENLIKYVSSHNNENMTIEKNDDESYSLILGFTVKKVQHMIESTNNTMTTLVMLISANKTVEQILLYNINEDLCDPRYVEVFNRKS